MKKFFLSFLVSLGLTGTIFGQGILDKSNYEFTNYVETQGCKFRMWVPPTSPKVKGVVVAFTQMQEVVSLDENLRDACLLEDLAIVWASQLGENDYPKLEAGLKALAEVSGMSEIANVPFATIAHSTAGIFCRTLAAAKPERCFAIVQLSAVDYRDNEILSDVPWLSVKNGAEETGDNWKEAQHFMINNKEAYTNPDGSPSGDDKAWTSPRGNGCRIALVSVPGGGHFGWSPMESELVANFIRKAAHYQLSLDNTTINRVPEEEGWLTDAEITDNPVNSPASFNNYSGDPTKAFWHLDEEMAHLWSKLHASEIAKTSQTVSQSTFDSNVWSNSSKRFDLKIGGVDSAFPTDASSDVSSNPIKVKLYNGIFKVVDGKDLYYSPARYGFNGSKDWITFYQEGTETHRYAEVTTGQVEASSFPASSDFSVSQIADVDINKGNLEYNVTGKTDDWIVSGNVYLSEGGWNIDPFTSVPVSQVYIRHAGGNHNNVKSTNFNVKNTRNNQTLKFDNTLPVELESGKQTTISLNATSSSSDAEISYYLISGPATLNGKTLITTGEEGEITILAISKSSLYNPAKAICNISVLPADAGVDTLMTSENILVYPTLTDGLVNIVNTPVGAKISLYDSNGRNVINKNTEGEYSTLSISHLPSGLYFLNVNGAKTVKIIRK